MKRMVLIPEEKLIRYEKQLNDQPSTNEQAGDPYSPFIILAEIIPDMIIYIIIPIIRVQ